MARAGCTLLICTSPGCPLAPSTQFLQTSPCFTSWPPPRPQQVTLNPSTSLQQLPPPASCPASFPGPGSHWPERGAEPGGLGGRGGQGTARAEPWQQAGCSTTLANPSCTGKSTDPVVTCPMYPRSRCIYHACVLAGLLGSREKPCNSCNGVRLKVSSYQISSHHVSSLPLFPFLGRALGSL